jgi:hypothetical protein
MALRNLEHQLRTDDLGQSLWVSPLPSEPIRAVRGSITAAPWSMSCGLFLEAGFSIEEAINVLP